MVCWKPSYFSYAYQGDLGCAPRIPGNATLEYEIELYGFHKSTRVCTRVYLYLANAYQQLQEAPLSERIQAANHVKSFGNRYLKKEMYVVALKQYHTVCSSYFRVAYLPQALSYFNEMENINFDVTMAELNSTKLALYLNLAACNYKMKRWRNTINFAEQVRYICCWL